MDYFIYAAIGLVMGLFGGLLGIGGSVVMIPAMMIFFKPNQHLYQAAAMICNFFVAFSACLVHKKARVLIVDVIKWLMFQVGGLGPMFGQFGHFVMFAKEDVPYAKRRYRGEAERIMDVLEDRLAGSPYLAGEDYSIADIASYSWVNGISQAMEMAEYASVARWLKKIAERPAVQKGMDVP